MATAVTTDPAQTFSDFPAQVVQYTTTPTNSGSWVTVPFLWCEELKLAVNAYSTAKLEWQVGKNLMQPGGTSFSEYQPLSLRGKYVRITIAQELPEEDIVWVGYVLNDPLQRDGVKTYGGTQKFEGEKQTFHCVGMEWFLDRVQNESSIVGDDTNILRALKFNGGESATIDMKAAHRGNRSENVNVDVVYTFSSDPTTEFKWTAADMVEYLLMYHGPKDKDGNDAPCTFSVNSTDADTILDGFEPTINREHATTFQLLNTIMSPQRGLCWWCVFDDVLGQAFIRCASMSRADITLPSGSTFPENADQVTFDFDSELDVKTCDVVNQGKRNYHRVTCRGARQTCTFTVGVHDTTLKTDWTTDAEVDYQSAAILDADYAGLSETKQKNRNDAYRLSDTLGRVYSYFRIPDDWDGKTGDGLTATKQYAIAEISDTGSRIGGLALHAQGIRLLNRTRLKLGVKYDDPTAPDTTFIPEGSLEEFLPPFAFVRVEKDGDAPSDLTAAKNRWQYVEKLNEPQFHAGTAVVTNIDTTYDLHMQEHVPGIKLRANGAPNHTLALDNWSPVDDGEPSKFKPEVTYDTLRATVCAEADYYAAGQADANPLPDSGVALEELIIDLGDDYRLDFLAENTIVDIKNGQCVKASSFAILRDDRAHLRDLATIALEWYREDRQQLTVSFRQLRNLFDLGQLVTTIGEGSALSTINTVVSVITYSFREGTTTLETVDSALDLRLVAGESRSRHRGKA